MRLEFGRNWVAGILCLLHATALVLEYRPHTFIRGDGVAYAFMDASLAQDGDLYLENNLPFPLGSRPESSLYALGANGRLWPKHPPFLPLVAFPFHLALGLNGLLLFNLLLLCGTVFVLSRFLPPRTSLLQGLAFASVFLLPYVFFHTYSFSPDMFLALLMAGMLWGLERKKDTTAGLMAGLMVFLRPNYVFQVLLGLPLARNKIRYALGAGLGLLPFIAYNVIAFGAPWTTGYARVVVATPAGAQIVSHAELFSYEPSRFLQIFTHWPRGLIFSAPIVFPLLLVLALKFKIHRRIAAFVFASWGWHYLFYAFYVPWLADHAGIRFLMPVVLMSSLGALAFAPSLTKPEPAVKMDGTP
jgi:hypothetical protein